jgi:hypothetical protein
MKLLAVLASLIGACVLVVVAGLSTMPRSVSPAGPPRQEWQPSITPDGRIEYLIAALTPPPTPTERATGVPYQTETPIPQCSDGKSGLCDRYSPTPTRTPQPANTPEATIAPCNQTTARYCLQTGDVDG